MPSSLLNEKSAFSEDAIAHALAHREQNEVRRAYARGHHWKERVDLMQWWADYLDAVAGATLAGIPNRSLYF